MSGRRTRLAVLDSGARMGDGTDFPPVARLCQGQPPVVYVPYSLVDRVYGTRASYPPDFLAFVIGHELAHRLSDQSAVGCRLPRSKRVARGAEAEQLADFRAAFFATVAGFSAQTLAKEAIVAAFLAAELALGRQAIAPRTRALQSALRDFDRYEALYQASLSLAAAGELEAAASTIERVSKLVRERGVPLPELEVVRAITLTMMAAPDAPWSQRHADLSAAAGARLRCTPVFPTHSALWEDGQAAKAGRPAAEALELLRRAGRALDMATRLGGEPLVIATTRACVALYRDDLDAAARWQGRAARLLRSGAPGVVRDAVASNAALLAFQKHLHRRPPPPDPAARARWVDALRAERDTFRAHAGLARFVAGAARASAKPRSPGCGGATTPPRLADGTGTPMSVPGASLTLEAFPPRSDGSDRIERWRCGCRGVRRLGPSDAGEVAWRVDCPEAGVQGAVLWATPAGRVKRVVRVAVSVGR